MSFCVQRAATHSSLVGSNATRTRLPVVEMWGINGVGIGIELDAEEGQVAADALAHEGVVLTDTGSEHEQIQAAQDCGQRADLAHDAAHVERQRDAGAFASLTGIILVLYHHARFGRNPGNTEKAGLVVKRAAHFFQRKSFDLHQVEQSAGIERARAGAHHQAVKRGKAHRGGDAFQVLHSAQAGPAAEVRNNGAASCQITMALGQSVAHVVVRKPVETVAAQTAFPG